MDNGGLFFKEIMSFFFVDFVFPVRIITSGSMLRNKLKKKTLLG